MTFGGKWDNTVDPQFSPLGAYSFFGFWHGGLFEGALKIFVVVTHVPFETFLLINYFFDSTHTCNGILLRTGKSLLINDCFFFPSTIKY